jgi:hypothetical protein
MEFDTKWSFAISKTLDHLSSFGVPQLNDLVKASTQKATAIITEAYISHSFTMTHICAHATSMS